MTKDTHFETHFYGSLTENSETLSLSPEESRHAIKVLRLRGGTRIRLCDGLGHLAEAVIETPDPQACRLRISTLYPQTPPPHVHLAIACLKDDDLEEVLEHCAQLPLASVTLLRTEHSLEPRNSDLGRLKRRLEMKALAALKQSRSTWLTRIAGPVFLRDWIATSRSHVLYADPRGNAVISNCALAAMRNRQNITLLTGPEGGLSHSEIELLEQHRAESISLGPTRLRARTAPLVALSTLYGQVAALNANPGIPADFAKPLA